MANLAYEDGSGSHFPASVGVFDGSSKAGGGCVQSAIQPTDVGHESGTGDEIVARLRGPAKPKIVWDGRIDGG